MDKGKIKNDNPNLIIINVVAKKKLSILDFKKIE